MAAQTTRIDATDLPGSHWCVARAWMVWVLAAGCGRLGFDARTTTTTDGDGGTSSLTLTYPRADVVAVLDATAVSLVPTVSDAAARFSVAPALPAGLVLDPATGIVGGTPSAAVDDVAYAITAATAGASASFTVRLTVMAGSVVTSTADLPDVTGGADAICAASNGLCTLRAAIQTANGAGTERLVLLDAQTYLLGSALPPITNDVELVGAGAQLTTIQAQTVHPLYPALSLASAHSLTLSDLTIQDFGGNQGGALSVTAGTLEVDRCAFTNNASPGSGGVLYITGGATATLRRCTFTGNASLGGSGGGWGGVIDGENAGTTIVVKESYATQNTTAWGSFSHITTGTTLRLENSTLYANVSTTAGTLATPGGIYTLVNDTIVGNTNTNATPDSAAIYLFNSPCHYTVTNTLVAFNTDKTGAEHNCNRRDLTTTLTSGGGNIFSDSAENCAAYFTGPGDLLNTAPGLAAAAPSDNGGLTLTMLLGPGSVAVDGGQNAGCPATDQRGGPRPMGAACDVGAVEMP
jgi:CSLREA domain-containing protein